jgi:GGDEF domain-containing protein
VTHLKNEIISKTTGLLILPVLRFFLDHDQKRALREKRSITLLVLELAALPSGASALAPTSELARHEGLRCLAQIKRKVDILGEYEGNRIALILPDTSLAQVRAVTDRIKKTVREELLSKLGPAAELYISISAADVMDHYPNLNFKPI